MSNRKVDVQKMAKEKRWVQGAVALLIACAMVLPAASPARAQEPAPATDTAAAQASALQVANGAAGVQISWGGAPVAAAAGVSVATADGIAFMDALAAQMPLQRYQGFDLPLTVVPMRFTGPEAVTLPQVTRIETMDLPAGLVVPGAPQLPPVLLEEGQEPPVSMETVALPEQPLFVVRQGWVKGEYLVMVAVSPIFAQGGVVKLATLLETNIPGASAIEVAPWDYAEARNAALDAADALQPAYAPDVEVAALDDAAAASSTLTLVVSKPGLQRISASDLGAAYTPAALADVSLTHRGALVPVQVVGSSEVRFYVESVGDRWNNESYYQISINAAKRSPAMATRTLAAPGGSGISMVIDRGEWKDQYGWPSKYSSNFAGTDGDHYFSAIFATRKADDAAPAFTADLRDPAKVTPPNTLPLVNANAIYTFTVTPNPSASAGITYTFKASSVDVTLEAGYGPTTTSFSNAGNPASMTVTFVPQSTPRGLLFETISFARPVTLEMESNGAIFWGNPTDTTYRWNKAPQFAGGYGVWDVTDPASPVVLTGASSVGFQDSEAGHRYLVAGPNFAHTPVVRAYRGLKAAALPAAQAIYIIPSEEYRAPLKPLTDLRLSQGYSVNVVDVTRIYDAYSGGYVDSRAIRSFLKDAYNTWKNPRPISAVLVGDGTYDPMNFEKRERAPVLMPPYMAEEIDRWMGEAPCDNCYGHFDDASAIFLTDIMIGRLPVKNLDEMATVISKIVNYETATDTKAAWRSTALYLADNYLKPQIGSTVCANGCPDGAGDFAKHADDVRALNPNRNNTNLTQRVYYDPFPSAQKPPAYGEWWRTVDRDVVRQRAVAGLQEGPALVVYNGHANVFNMGELEQAGTTERKFLLGLYDSATLYRANQLYVQLSMTCLTSSFATPANSATTIDEDFFLWPRGGAVAVWGPTGQSVVVEHEALQLGFFQQLFKKPNTPARVGDLIQAGYFNLALTYPASEEILRTFVLLGDPLTKLNYRTGSQSTYLPAITK